MLAILAKKVESVPHWLILTAIVVTMFGPGLSPFFHATALAIWLTNVTRACVAIVAWAKQAYPAEVAADVAEIEPFTPLPDTKP